MLTVMYSATKRAEGSGKMLVFHITLTIQAALVN